MAKPIYKMYVLRLIEPWYALSLEERSGLLDSVDAARKAVGGKQVILCDSAWSSEQWQGFGIEEFPDIEAVQKHTQLLNELGWFRYYESVTVLGTGAPGS